MLFEFRVEFGEHLLHVLFRSGAFDNDNKFRLVGRSANEAPRAVFRGDANSVHSHDVANLLSNNGSAILRPFFEGCYDFFDNAILYLVGAMRRHGWRLPSLRKRLAQIGKFLARIVVEHFEERDGGTLMHDRVEYRIPGGVFAAIPHVLFVRKNIEQIFRYRKTQIQAIFSGAEKTETVDG